jgi:hypothetical protein
MIQRLPLLPIKQFLRVLFGGSLPTLEEGQYLYGYARQALEDAFRLFGLHPGDVVLYPDYICDSCLAACHHLGLTVKYYSVGDDLEPEWGALEALAQGGARAVLTVNYFGFPGDLERWEALVRHHRLWWIEDNAHGYGSRFHGRELGRWGHVGLDSMRKVLPLLNGACLWINDSDLRQRANQFHFRPFLRGSGFGWEETRLMLKFISQWAGLPLHRLRRRPVTGEMPASDEHQRPLSPMDPLSARIFAILKVEQGEYTKRRQVLYRTWERFCTAQGLTAAFPALPPEVSPQVFPCYAPNFVEQQRWLAWGRRVEVDVHPWPSLPLALRGANSRPAARWQRLLCFPIHQHLSPESITKLPPPTQVRI